MKKVEEKAEALEQRNKELEEKKRKIEEELMQLNQDEFDEDMEFGKVEEEMN